MSRGDIFWGISVGQLVGTFLGFSGFGGDIKFRSGNRTRRVDTSGGLVFVRFRMIMCGWGAGWRNLVGHSFRCNILLVHAC